MVGDNATTTQQNYLSISNPRLFFFTKLIAVWSKINDWTLIVIRDRKSNNVMEDLFCSHAKAYCYFSTSKNRLSCSQLKHLDLTTDKKGKHETHSESVNHGLTTWITTYWDRESEAEQVYEMTLTESCPLRVSWKSLSKLTPVSRHFSWYLSLSHSKMNTHQTIILYSPLCSKINEFVFACHGESWCVFNWVCATNVGPCTVCVQWYHSYHVWEESKHCPHN